MSETRHFSKKTELLNMKAGTTPVQAWHTGLPGFGARIMPKTKKGAVLRTYIYRDTRHGNDKQHRLGRFDEITYEKAYGLAHGMRSTAMNVVQVAPLVAPVVPPVEVPTLTDALAGYLLAGINDLADATVVDYTKKWGLLNEPKLRKPKRLPKKRVRGANAADAAAAHTAAQAAADEAWSVAQEAKAIKDGTKGVLPFTDVTRLDELNSKWWLNKYNQVFVRNGEPSAIGLYRTARAVYQHYVELGEIEANPLVYVKRRARIGKRPARKEFIQSKDLPPFWNWLQTRTHPSTRDFILINLLSGLRLGAVGGLRWEHIIPEHRMFKVPVDRKGSRVQTLVEMPIPNELWRRVFEPRLAARQPEDDCVLPSAKLAGQPAVSVRTALINLKVATGIKCTAQILRRTFAVFAQAATGDALVVGRMLTHNAGATGASGAAGVTGGYISIEEDPFRIALNKAANLIVHHCLTVQPELTDLERFGA